MSLANVLDDIELENSPLSDLRVVNRGKLKFVWFYELWQKCAKKEGCKHLLYHGTVDAKEAFLFFNPIFNHTNYLVVTAPDSFLYLPFHYNKSLRNNRSYNIFGTICRLHTRYYQSMRYILILNSVRDPPNTTVRENSSLARMKKKDKCVTARLADAKTGDLRTAE